MKFISPHRRPSAYSSSVEEGLSLIPDDVSSKRFSATISRMSSPSRYSTSTGYDGEIDRQASTPYKPFEFEFLSNLTLGSSTLADRAENVSLHGSYDDFFKTGFNKRRFSVGSDYDSDISSEDRSDYNSSCASNYDSESDDEDTRNSIPSFCATAVRVKITPLTAVRRTVRRSYLLDHMRPRKSSAEDSIFNPYWSIFMKARDAPAPTEEIAPPVSAEDLEPKKTRAEPKWELITRKLSVDNLRRIVSTRKGCDSAVDPLDSHAPRPASLTASQFEKEMEENIDILEFHDVTQEAARLAAMMSFKWEFKPRSETDTC